MIHAIGAVLLSSLVVVPGKNPRRFRRGISPVQSTFVTITIQPNKRHEYSMQVYWIGLTHYYRSLKRNGPLLILIVSCSCTKSCIFYEHGRRARIFGSSTKVLYFSLFLLHFFYFLITFFRQILPSPLIYTRHSVLNNSDSCAVHGGSDKKIYKRMN